jgi:hypothetical protein
MLKQKIQSLDQNFKETIDLLKDNYVAYELDKSYEPNKKLYERDMAQLGNNKSDIFILENKIEKSNSGLDQIIFNYSKLIDQYKKQNKNLEKEYNSLKNKGNASVTMLNDSYTFYKFKLILLILECLGVFSIYGVLYYQIKK